MPAKNINTFLTTNTLNLSSASILTIVGGELKRLTGQSIAIDANGRFGIGITSPSAPLSVQSDANALGIRLNGRSADNISDFSFYANDNVTQYANIQGRSTDLRFASIGTIPTTFYVNGSERVRIDSNGNIGIGTSTWTNSPNAKLLVSENAAGSTITLNTARPIAEFVSTSLSTRGIRVSTSNGTNRYIDFVMDNQNGNATWYANAGTITVTAATLGVNLAANATAWTAVSDKNLKNITGTIQNGLDKVSQINAIEFTWKNDENKKPCVGLIAQEIQKILPEAVDNLPDGYLGVRYTEVIPLLVKCIQELKEEINILKNK